MTDQTCGVVAVLQRMRGQADYGRCSDSNFTAKDLIRQIDEDRAALNAVAELIAADEEYDEALRSVPVGMNLPYEAVLYAIPRIQAAIDRRAAALAACKGGA